MIISKTPFRISLFGGSTDYKSFYSKYGSLLIGFALDKYCYISIRETPAIFPRRTKLSYSKNETVLDNNEIEHNGIRGTLEYLHLMENKYELIHLSDLPSQTGIGSSSSFIVGLLNCLTKECPKKLAEDSIFIERELLKEPGGIQDQIWAAYGGFNSITILPSGDFVVRPLPISENFIIEFFNRSILIYTGQERQSFEIASSHDSYEAEKYKENIYRLAQEAYLYFNNEDIDGIANLLYDSWEQKRQISNLISTSKIDLMYKSLQQNGMIGGKLLGTGGSGFIFGILNKNVDKNTFKNKYKNYYVDINYSKQGSIIINE